MNYKRLLNVLLINLSIFLLLFSFLELYSYKKLTYTLHKAMIRLNVKSSDDEWKVKYEKINKFNYLKWKKLFRPVLYGSEAKRPLIFFGCSFIYGFGLENNQTLPYKIARLTNRTVYNRAYNCWGAQHVLYQLKRKDFEKEVPDAEFIIYTFIYDHLNRLNRYTVGLPPEMMLRYEILNNKPEELKPSFLPLYSLFTVRYIQDSMTKIKNKNYDNLIYLFNTIMDESIRLSHQKYPNSKFVILEYRELNYDISDEELLKFNQNIKNLINRGFIVIDLQKLVGHELNTKEYLLDDGFHPSEKAWEEIAPKLVKYLKL